MTLSRATTERLTAAGIDLALLPALCDSGLLRKCGDNFEFRCVQPNGSTVWHCWRADGTPIPWPPSERAATWWPVGKGSTAIVVVGVESGLALLSMLYHVAPDGEIRRRPNLPGILADAVPVILPETLRGVATEWILDDEAPLGLLDQLAGFRLAFLALPVEPTGFPPTEIIVRSFIYECAMAAPEGLTVAPILLPSDVQLTDPPLAFHGHGRRFALAGILEFWLRAALHPPAKEDE